MQKIIPIILAGGIGKRLWPMSRESYPKQFLKFENTLSLFQKTVQRFQRPEFQRPIIVTNEDYRFHVVEQMGEIGTLPELILLEPMSRNTAGAVLAAALAQARKDPSSICVVAPSDHQMPDPESFARAVVNGMPAVEAGQIVTFGIKPNRPETGYGYLELAGPTDGSNAPIPVLSFTEKPNLATAKEMVDGGTHLWNAGVFMFRCSDIISSCDRYSPDICASVKMALAGSELDLGFTRLSESEWRKLPDISLDYAVMEHADNITAVPYDGAWSDLGSWQGYWQETRDNTRPKDGVVKVGNAHDFDCHNTLLMSETPKQAIVGLGLRDLVAVAMQDAVLIADRSRTGEIGAVVQALTTSNVSQATVRPRDFRPWGWFEQLVDGPGFQVKLITVHPRGVLSLQSHTHRAEHWVVVEGSATVTIRNSTFELSANQSTYIPTGELHRLENTAPHDLKIIEVQTGAYLGEDDIVRYEDAYARQ